MRKAFIVPAAIFLLVQTFNVPPARADADETLHVGDSAPALSCGKWLKGEPVAKLEQGKIYVVEFWATWCGPCRESIPHLSKLQAEHKDIIFIGQDCWEQDQAAAEPFVKEMGDKMDYRVALDDTAHEPTGAMTKSWMTAAGQNGIPTAFVVDKTSHIIWIGHPMELDDVLKSVLAGKLDAKTAAARAAADKIGESINASLVKQDYDKALSAADEMIRLQPDQAARFGVRKFQILLMKPDDPAAWALGKNLAESCKDDAAALNDLAWMIVDPAAGIKSPDLDLAEKLAARACEVTKNQNASFLDTRARVEFAKGEIDKAIETQSSALAIASALEKVGMSQDLAEYKAAKGKRQK